MANLDTLTAAQVAAGVAAGDFSATEVAKASLDAVESRDPAIQAFLRQAVAEGSEFQKTLLDMGRIFGVDLAPFLKAAP